MIVRIKTKEELINKLGNNWRDIGRHVKFVEEMDIYLGKMIFTHPHKISEWSNDFYFNDYCFASIYYDILTYDKDTKDNNKENFILKPKFININ